MVSSDFVQISGHWSGRSVYRDVVGARSLPAPKQPLTGDFGGVSGLWLFDSILIDMLYFDPV